MSFLGGLGSTETLRWIASLVVVQAAAVVQSATPPAKPQSDVATPTSASPGTVKRNVPIIRISTDLIQIDAVVTDKAGQPVVDLKAEDFEVFESGQRQRVSHLVYVSGAHGATGGADTAGTAVVAVAPPPESLAPRTVLVVVDDLFLSLEGAVATHKGLVNLVQNGLSAFDRMGIVTTSAHGRVYLTWDREAFAKAAAAVRYKVWRGIDARVRRMDSVRVLKASVNALRALPGRKAVIFVSDDFSSLEKDNTIGPIDNYGFRLADTLYEDSGIRAALNSLTDLANRASVVIYTIDASGVPPNALFAADSPGSTDPRSTQSGLHAFDRRNRQQSLIDLAEDTGGIGVYGRNDIDRALEDVLSDHAGYYLIGYEPQASTFAPGAVAFHEVKVRVKRAGLNVRSRKGFYGVSDEAFAKAAPRSE